MKRDKWHGFPEEVKLFEKYGKRFFKEGNDKKMYEHLHIDGGYGKYEGRFEFIKDTNGNINHRLFKGK